ncbi:MAG: putative porin [Dysgonamonadaceae bacterium]|nr:putative porin [Dysgonamonadaceae bacterium]
MPEQTSTELKSLELPDSLNVPTVMPDTAHMRQRMMASMGMPENLIDTTQRIAYWRITKRTGEIVLGNPDTLLTDYPNRTHADGMSVAVAYAGNLGQPLESRVYFDRPDRSDFMFADPYYYYAFAPEKHNYVNTKIPFSNLTYQTAGSRENKEERLLGALSINFGKKLNVGMDVNYLYARGFYNSQAAKRMDWDLYGSYIADRHQVHAFINPFNATNAENGGISDDLWITDPIRVSNSKVQTRNIPTLYSYTWNRLKGTEYFLNYRYNLGFERETEKVDSLGETVTQFIPVSSIIFTFNYGTRFRKFNTTDSNEIDPVYGNRDYWGTGLAANDSTSYWYLNNTLGLSLREGFSEWAKFDLTAFLTQKNRKYTLPADSVSNADISQESTYIGGEIAKRTGEILRYDAQAEFGVVGYNLGDFQLSGKIETRIPLFQDTVSVIARGYIKNLEPSFYEKNFHSKYIWWNNSFGKVKKVFFGGTFDFPLTKTNLTIGVENVNNYIYFVDAEPNGEAVEFIKQHTGNIQILAATLQQNFQFGALHWDNQLVYQTSSDQSVIPLPDLCAYSNLYLNFVAAKVLTIQIGGNMHYFTDYYAPIYEPVTQQFRLQHEKELGNYPIISGYVNCHLKNTRFFIEFYNLSSSFISPPAYFSMLHYPLNPQIFKLGLSWNFLN